MALKLLGKDSLQRFISIHLEKHASWVTWESDKLLSPNDIRQIFWGKVHIL